MAATPENESLRNALRFMLAILGVVLFLVLVSDFWPLMLVALALYIGLIVFKGLVSGVP